MISPGTEQYAEDPIPPEVRAIGTERQSRPGSDESPCLPIVFLGCVAVGFALGLVVGLLAGWLSSSS